MATLTTFRTNVSAIIGLDNSVAGDQPLIDDWVNKGVLQVLIDTRCHVTSQTVTPAAQDYTMSSVLEIVDMYFTASGNQYRLRRVTVPELLDLRLNSSSAAPPARYYALAGADLLMFYPAPGASDTLTMYYVPVPTALSSGSDDPSTAANGGIPVALHAAIELWALKQAADYDDDQSSGQGQRYGDLYREQIGKARSLLLRRGGRRLPAARPGRPLTALQPGQDDIAWP